MAYDPKNYNKLITKILNRVKHGNTAAMTELFDKTYNHFCGIALVKIWDKSKAEDAVMSMYENIMKYIESFDAKKGGVGWMFTILSRIIYNLNAEEQAVKQYEQPIIDNNSLDDINLMYETIGLSDFVSELDDEDRKMVFMLYFERRTLSEIADILRLSTSAVHKRKQQILKKLKS
ncbi:MAG: sigma-70 family RNA polymerase sigma factor [Clostridiales bacterium]|nr:sigma-70 family RNA polymerase sigma factor [Clostridiales bacterium]